MESPILTTVFFFISVASVVWLLVGLVSPQRAIRWGDESQKTRKRVMAYGIGAAVVSMVLAGIVAPPLTPEQKAIIEQKKAEKQQKEEAAKLEKQQAKEREEAQKAESEKKDTEEPQKSAENKELQDKYDKQAQYEEWLKWKEANEYPYMKYLTADDHPKYNDSEKSVKKFYDKAGLDDYIVYTEGTQSNKKNDDWLFWYAFSRQDSVDEIICAFSRINGGMSLEEALPIILTYLPNGEVNNHRRSFYKEDKQNSSKGFYCFQFSGQMYLSVFVEDGCVSKFIIGHSAPNTGRGINDSHIYKDISYDLAPFVK